MTGTQQLTDRIAERIDTARMGELTIAEDATPAFRSMSDVMEFAKAMATADLAVPAHLRGKPGNCLAVTMQAMRWRMDPFAVANKSYEVNGRMAYEAQLIAAVIDTRAPVVDAWNAEYTGTEHTRKLRVWRTLRGAREPKAYTSPELGRIKPKHSPLWVTDPDQQLWYYTTRAWARRWCPAVILGVYTPDEIRDGMGAHEAGGMIDVTPAQPQPTPGPQDYAGAPPSADEPEDFDAEAYLAGLERALNDAAAAGYQPYFRIWQAAVDELAGRAELPVALADRAVELLKAHLQARQARGEITTKRGLEVAAAALNNQLAFLFSVQPDAHQGLCEWIKLFQAGLPDQPPGRRR